MYLEYYGFEREPFHITPDPEFLFLSPSHKEAFATVVYGVEQRKGFVALTGEVGTGKTTILRAYLKRIERSPIRPIYLFNPDLSFDELLRLILREMGEELKGEPVQTMLDRLQWLLVQEYKENHNVVLIIDEAQNMPVETLEKLRMLSNLETAKDKLIQIVLVGQPELQEKLELHDLRQLRQRIAVRAIIRSLTPAQSLEYIRYRLTQAGCLRESVFSKAALRVIVRRAKGNPRLLNILCDNSLIAGFGAMEQSVSARIVREVARDVFGNPWKKASLKWAAAAAAMVLVGGISVVLAYAGTTGSDVSRSKEAVQLAHVAAPAVAQPDAVAETPAPVTQVTPVASPAADAPDPDPAAAAPINSVAEAAPAGEKSPDNAPVSTPPPSAPVQSLPAKTLDHKDIALRKMNELMARRDQPLPAESASVETVSAPDAVAPPTVSVSVPADATGSDKAVVPASAPPTAPPAVPVSEPESAPDVTPAEREVGVVEVPASPAVADSTDEPAQDAVPEPAIQLASAQPDPAAPAAAEAPVAAPQPAAPIGTAAESPETPVAPAASVELKKPELVAAPAVTQRVPAPATTIITDSGETIRLLPRYVHRGDCLTRLVAEVYGRSTPSLVETVRRYNPHVLNADIIWYGDTLVFPERIVDERGVVQTASIPGEAPPGE